MKKIALIAVAMLSFGIATGPAEAQGRPGGCLKYGLGGAARVTSRADIGSRVLWQAVPLGSINAESTSERSGSRTKSGTGFRSADARLFRNETTVTIIRTGVPIGLPCPVRRGPVPMKILALAVVARLPVSRPVEARFAREIQPVIVTVIRLVGRSCEIRRRAVIVLRTGAVLPTLDG
jgi:hypothetical protein